MSSLLSRSASLCLVGALLFANICSSKSLNFKPDGTFKILQFSDLYMNDSLDTFEITLDMIQTTIDTEQPDLVVLTGDTI